jgi:hypothetical protein
LERREPISVAFELASSSGTACKGAASADVIAVDVPNNSVIASKAGPKHLVIKSPCSPA